MGCEAKTPLRRLGTFEALKKCFFFIAAFSFFAFGILEAFACFITFGFFAFVILLSVRVGYKVEDEVGVMMGSAIDTGVGDNVEV